MPRAICPVCKRLITITPDRQIAEGFSARWQRLADHSDPRKTVAGPIIVETRCEGSGRKV